jgi:putative ABC transport system ATP-binding protein
LNISLRDVTKEYDLDETTTITPVRHVDLNISPGQFIIIIGRSGSGKTTLLNLAAGLVKPSLGKVLADGVDLRDMTDGQLSLLRSQKIGFVFQFPSLLPTLTIVENVFMPSAFIPGHRNGFAKKRAEELLETVGLAQKISVYPRQLSAGEQKRAVIARALMNKPEIILADEPTSDLDEQTEEEIMALLREIQAGGVAFMMVTHSLQLVPYATRAYKMENSSLHTLEKVNVS